MNFVNQENIIYKKIISSILVVALLNLLGCYSSNLVTVPEYKQVEEEEGKPDEIYVKTEDYREYHFPDSDFYIENDTLYGKAKLLYGEEGLPFEGKIALGEIESIQFERYYKPKILSVYEFQKFEAVSDKPDEIYLTKYDSTRYHFMKNDYYMVNDTLFGKGKIIIDGGQQLHRENQLDRKLALSEIESIEVKNLDTVSTTFYAVLLMIVIAGVFVFVYNELQVPEMPF